MTTVFQTAGKIISGAHSLNDLHQHIDQIGKNLKKLLIVASPSSQRLGYVAAIEEQLQKKRISSFVNIDVLPEPTKENIEAVHKAVSAESFDGIIGIGGGSVLDAAKILSVLQTNRQQIDDMLGVDQVENPGLPVVLIPTTSGTGSEVTPNAIVTLPEQELKIGIVSRHLLPQLVIIDPVLTIELPKPITAATGMDAYTHAIESFISNKSNPLSDMFALESIRLLSRGMIEAYENGRSLAAREQMLIGSMYGGMALSCAGTAAVHALAYPLGGKFGITHGVANSMLLPHVMEFNMDAIAGRLSQAAQPMGIDITGKTKAQAAEAVVDQMAQWAKVLNIPNNLKDYGVESKDVPELAVAASKVTRLLNNNPKTMSLTDMEQIYQKLLPISLSQKTVEVLSE